MLVVVGGVVAAAALITIASVTGSVSEQPRQPAQAQAAAVAPAEPTPPTEPVHPVETLPDDKTPADADPEKTPPSNAEEPIEIAFEVVPRRATVLLDDMLLTRRRFPTRPSKDVHTVVIEAKGYVSQTRQVVFDENRTIKISLEKKVRTKLPKNNDRKGPSGRPFVDTLD
jgi:outer membrane biosynthesis protein TonB